MTKSTRPFTLDERTYRILKSRGVRLECSYQRCEDKEFRLGQSIVSVTRGSGYGGVTKRYHEECREKSYLQPESESDTEIVMFIKDRGVATTDELGEFLAVDKQYAAQLVRPMVKAGLIFVVNLRVRRGEGSGGSIKYGGRTLFNCAGNKNLYYVDDDALVKHLVQALNLNAKLPPCKKRVITQHLRTLLPPEVFQKLYETYTSCRVLTISKGR